MVKSDEGGCRKILLWKKLYVNENHSLFDSIRNKAKLGEQTNLMYVHGIQWKMYRGI